MVNNIAKTHKLDTFELIVAFSLFFTTEVYLKWNSGFWSAFTYIILLATVVFLLSGKARVSGENVFFVILFGVLFMWTVYSSDISLAKYVTRFLMPFVIFIPWQKREKYLDFFLCKVFPILIGLSLLTYILLQVGIGLPSFTVKALNELKGYNYTSYFFCVVPNDIVYAMRFHSYYDEPGVVGTLMGVIIFYYHQKLNSFSTFIYIVAGLLSFSLFFFIAILAYLLFESEWKGNKKIYAIASTLFLAIVVFSFFENSFLIDNVFGRFSFQNGEWVGNNRNSTIFEDYFYGTFVYSNEFWTGTSGDTSLAGGSSSFEKVIFLRGAYYLLYCLFIYLFLFLRYKYSWYQFSINFGLWLGLMYQRPSFDVFFFYLFFITVIQSQFYRAKQDVNGNLITVKN